MTPDQKRAKLAEAVASISDAALIATTTITVIADAGGVTVLFDPPTPIPLIPA